MIIGSICDCGTVSHAAGFTHHDSNTVLGIPKLEAAAEVMRDIIKDNVQKFWNNNFDIFSEDEKIEILTRDLARGYEDEGTRKRLVEDPELETVLFDVVYPLFGFRHDRAKVEAAEGVKVDKGVKPDERAKTDGEVEADEGVKVDKGVRPDERAKTDEGWSCLVQ
jgi:hypothetical protein